MTTLQALSTTAIESLIREHSPAITTLQSIILGGLEYELKARQLEHVLPPKPSVKLTESDFSLMEALENL